MKPERISFPEIVRMYQQPVYWYIRRVVLIHEDAEDILQETFLKAFKGLWMLRSETSLRPWLFRIATNEMNRYFRKKDRSVSLDDVPAAEPCELGDASPERASEVISSAVLKMTPLQRQVFCLRYYEEMDYDRIAEVTGSSRNSLMVSYHEARKMIEKEIML